jgi:hypothetical protein
MPSAGDRLLVHWASDGWLHAVVAKAPAAEVPDEASADATERVAGFVVAWSAKGDGPESFIPLQGGVPWKKEDTDATGGKRGRGEEEAPAPAGKGKKARKDGWTDVDDGLLLAAMAKSEYAPDGAGRYPWAKIAADPSLAHLAQAGSGPKVKNRYNNNLAPGLAKHRWTPAEDATLLALQQEHGNTWAAFTAHLPGRSKIDMKQRHKTLMNREKGKG